MLASLICLKSSLSAFLLADVGNSLHHASASTTAVAESSGSRGGDGYSHGSSRSISTPITSTSTGVTPRTCTGGSEGEGSGASPVTSISQPGRRGTHAKLMYPPHTC